VTIVQATLPTHKQRQSAYLQVIRKHSDGVSGVADILEGRCRVVTSVLKKNLRAQGFEMWCCRRESQFKAKQESSAYQPEKHILGTK
jgi:hypothetical protein